MDTTAPPEASYFPETSIAICPLCGTELDVELLAEGRIVLPPHDTDDLDPCPESCVSFRAFDPR